MTRTAWTYKNEFIYWGDLFLALKDLAEVRREGKTQGK